MRWIAAWICVVLIFVAAPIHARSKLDIYFCKYSRMYFGSGFDWKWFKAQGRAESNLNPAAVSPVGARGVMQIMPGTWAEICRKQRIVADITEARWNIAAGIFYDWYLWSQWRSKRPEIDRLALMFASYNAGLGTILKAQRLCISTGDCHDCNLWVCIQNYDHAGWIRAETLIYVIRIFKFMGKAYAN